MAQHRFACQLLLCFFLKILLSVYSLAMGPGLFFWQLEPIPNCMKVGNVAPSSAEGVGCFAGIVGRVHWSKRALEQ